MAISEIESHIAGTIAGEIERMGSQKWDEAVERATELLANFVSGPEEFDSTGAFIEAGAQPYLALFMLRCPEYGDLIIEHYKAWQ